MKASIFVLGIASVAVALPTWPASPIVDLGYGLYQATINDTGKTYNFSNIRYAAPPVGAARFSAPTLPTVNRTVNNGQQLAICPQADPAWELIAGLFLSGAPLSTLEAELAAISALTASSVPKPGPNENEDCLSLDVIVPEAIYNGRSSAPVLVWIYGGGYTGGSKTFYDPSGLLRQAQKDGGPGFVYVAINYRLGMFGWLSGPTFQQGGTANAGLHDQRLALEWVQANIHRFGGDPRRVTVMGESAGGGSIMHQITAYGGLKGKAPFQQAIPQSAAWAPVPDQGTQENTFNTVLKYASQVAGSPITTLDELRALPTYTLQIINKLTIALSTYGSFTFGPTVDGDFVPASPGLLLLHGQFDHDLKLLIGHNAAETVSFTSPFIQNNTAFNNFLVQTLPAATPATISYIENTLYPPVYDGSQPYTDPLSRAQLAVAEIAFTCNSRYLAHAFENETHNYFFTVPPALHGQDIDFTFFNDIPNETDDGNVVSPAVAHQLQDYITNFVVNGDPNHGVAVPTFPTYGSGSQVLDIDSAADGKVQTDTLTSGRCEWWQLGLYD